ncbi:MAG: coiled coil domain-containing protein [Desulforhopalus sp.]
MSKKEAYEQKFEAQLNEWKAEADKLQAKADKADADVRIKYHEQLEKLQAKEQETRVQLAQLKNASEDSWQDLKKGLEEAGNSLKKTFSSIKSNFS